MKTLFKVCLFSFFIFFANGPNALSGNIGVSGPENSSDYARKLLATNQPRAAELKLSEVLIHYPRSIKLWRENHFF